MGVDWEGAFLGRGAMESVKRFMLMSKTTPPHIGGNTGAALTRPEGGGPARRRDHEAVEVGLQAES